LQALLIVAAIVLGTIAFALQSVRKIKMNPQEFLIGGRSFGALLLWILLAGEVYTSFTFLGAAGWAYGRGAPAFYILAYGTIGYIIGYFFLPAVWKIGKERNLLTFPDFFLDRFQSKPLAVGIAVLQFFLVVPYVTLQLSGLQTLLRIAGYGQYDATVAVGVAFVLITLFVFTAGLRGTAWASVVKDALVLGAVIFAGIFLPMHFFGSPAAAIDRVLQTHPHWFTLLPSSADHGTIWYISTVLLSSIGFYMGPHTISAVYSAKSGDVLRRNAIFLPIYQLVLLLVFFAGFAALVIVPGLTGPAVDSSFMLVVQKFYPPWILGLVAGAGCLAALLPASALLLGAAGVFAKNVLGDALSIATSENARTLATRILVLVVAAMSLVFWIFYYKTLVELLLFYYNGVTQFMPGFTFGLIWRRVSAPAVACGIIAGELAVVFLMTHPAIDTFGINPGFFALVLNVIVCVGLTLARPRKSFSVTERE
ncbi:MAG: sodium:solute symporter family protein, partial [Candidatus Eremiobacteraeota bacterium]|nr:sodium:solute symporter family protein [Candidatus Eremiobacteraeota bacterium]